MPDRTIQKGILRSQGNANEDPHDVNQIYIENTQGLEGEITAVIFLSDGKTKEVTKQMAATDGRVNLYDSNEQVPIPSETGMESRTEPQGALKGVVGMKISTTAEGDLSIMTQDTTWRNIDSLTGVIPEGKTVGFGRNDLPPIVEKDGSADTVLEISKEATSVVLTIANEQELIENKLVFAKLSDGYKISAVNSAGYTFKYFVLVFTFTV